MNREDCFTPLRHKAVELPDYIQWLLDQDIEWAEHFGFQTVPLPSDFIQIEPAQELDKIWQIKRLGLLRVEPMSVYDWHVDEYRQSCVNMLYSTYDSSHTLFGQQRDALNKDVIELKYQYDTFYLFNNQNASHGHQPRWPSIPFLSLLRRGEGLLFLAKPLQWLTPKVTGRSSKTRR